MGNEPLRSSAASQFSCPSQSFCCFAPSIVPFWGRPDDEAPAAAPTEAAERGEEEQTSDQHRRYSRSGGNEIKGMEQPAAASRRSRTAPPASTALGRYSFVFFHLFNLHVLFFHYSKLRIHPQSLFLFYFM